jgi:hypothetical protein
MRWYYSLKNEQKGLLKDHPIDSLEGKCVVCQVDGDIRKYALFENYLDFANFYHKLSPEKRSFYEVIIGKFSQKPHFDIDIQGDEVDGDEMVKEIIKIISNLWEEKELVLDLNDVLVYTSHGKDGEGHLKQSYHLIINNWCHSNNNEAKELYKRIFDLLPKEWKNDQWFDPKVYGPLQLFRILGSSKQQKGKRRYKKFVNDFIVAHTYPEEPEDEDHLWVMELEESIISNTSGCKTLPSFSKFKEEERKTIILEEGVPVTKDEVTRALEMCAQVMGCSKSQLPFQVRDVEGVFIILERLKATFCSICQRKHENENPYMFIEGETIRNVFFNCRRNDRHIYLGSFLGSTNLIEKDAPSPTTDTTHVPKIKKPISKFNMSLIENMTMKEIEIPKQLKLKN